MFQVSGARIYARLFDESEEGPFEFPPGCTQVGAIRKSVSGDTKLCVLQEIKSVCAFCSLSCELLFVGDKFTADHFEDKIIPLIKSN